MRYLDRTVAVRLMTSGEDSQPAKSDIHALVEHTSINPNKAAHIGHLRNAILGDTFVRLLKAAGRQVAVQNYIDNTGVQVADVVVGFLHLEKKSLAEIRTLIEDLELHFQRVDYYCWDLYARTSQWYIIGHRSRERRTQKAALSYPARNRTRRQRDSRGCRSHLDGRFFAAISRPCCASASSTISCRARARSCT